MTKEQQEYQMGLERLLKQALCYLEHPEVKAIPFAVRTEVLVSQIKKLFQCGKKTLAPDDLILPCIREANHEGFCDTGR